MKIIKNGLSLLIIMVSALLFMGCDKETTQNTTIKTNGSTTTTATEVDNRYVPPFKNNADSFMMVVLPDTQRYTQNYPSIFKSQTQWIADNYEQYNLKFVSHVGDLVQNGVYRTQWDIADEAFDILDESKIPYGVTAGNHDIVGNMSEFYTYKDNNRPTNAFYLDYFSKSRTSQVTENYGGHSDNGWNSYYFFEANGRTYLVLFIDYAASVETFTWVNGILNENKDVPTIIVTHILSKPIGTDGSSNISCTECSDLWYNVIYKNNQVFMAINGHYNGSGYEIKKNKFGNDVLLMVVDYQNEYHGGNGWLRLVEFDHKNNLISAYSISPYVMTIPEKDRTEDDLIELTGSNNKYSVPFNFNER